MNSKLVSSYQMTSGILILMILHCRSIYPTNETCNPYNIPELPVTSTTSPLNRLQRLLGQNQPFLTTIGAELQTLWQKTR